MGQACSCGDKDDTEQEVRVDPKKLSNQNADKYDGYRNDGLAKGQDRLINEGGAHSSNRGVQSQDLHFIGNDSLLALEREAIQQGL